MACVTLWRVKTSVLESPAYWVTRYCSVDQGPGLRVARRNYRLLDELDYLANSALDRGRGVSTMPTQSTPDPDKGHHVDIYREQ